MFLIDLKDEYFQIPVHPESYMYLRFVVQGKVYQFRALCFGLSITSQVFTSVWSGVGVNSSEGDLPALLSG